MRLESIGAAKEPPNGGSVRRLVRLLDLFCCAGGAGMGYHLAGFEVVGVDIEPQSRYPFEFHQGDALKYLLEHHHEFDAFHASPPCQAHTNCQKLRGNYHPDYIAATRSAFRLIGKPWIIENVPGAPMENPMTLCGCMFPDLQTYRPRLFESNCVAIPAECRPHTARTTKMGRPPQAGEFMHVVGNFSGVNRARAAMGIDWMSRDELREAIPPAYTERLGRELLSFCQTNDAPTRPARREDQPEDTL